MQLRFTFFFFIFCFIASHLYAQNTTPYWSLAGNNNATATSKFGTTNLIPFNLTTNNLTRLRIDPNGSVGIGLTTTPATLFQVNGFGSFGNKVTAANATRSLNLVDDNAVMRILRTHASFAPAVELISRTSADGANVAYWDLYAEPSDKSFRIRDRVTGANLDRITVSNSGNVGIGTTAPTQKLEVAGNGNFTGELYLRGNRFASRGPATATNSTFVGVGAGAAATSGQNNTAVGADALFTNATGYGNTAIGSSALRINNEGFNNTALGHFALYYNTTGFQNTAAGYSSLVANSTGSFNTGFGMWTLFYNQTGSYNTALGYGAADYSHGYSDATFLGANTRANDNLSNFTAVGFGARATASNQVMLGNTAITAVVAAGSFMIYSDGRFKRDIQESVPGLAFINKLRPVTYHYNIQGLNSHVRTEGRPDVKRESAGTDRQAEAMHKAKEEESIRSKEKKLYTGFVAQEVEKAAKELNYEFSGIHRPTGEKDVYALSYAEFVVPLVKAVQELSKENEALKNELTELKQLIGKMVNGQNVNASLSNAVLLQNAPNPVRGTTTIQYALPEGSSRGQLLLTDALGRTIKAIPLTSSGVVNLDASSLSSGVYNYSLVVDGKTLQTKKMTIER